MTDDLVKRLRARRDRSVVLTSYPPQFKPDSLCQEAADCIEALEKERDEWKLRTMTAMHFVPDNVTFGEIRNIRAALAGEKKDG